MSKAACKLLRCLGGNRAENGIISDLVDKKKLPKKTQDIVIKNSSLISKLQIESMELIDSAPEKNDRVVN